MEYKVFWCRVNKYYTNKWWNYLSSLPNFDKNDKILIASCVVTDRAKKKRLKEIKKNIFDWKKVYLTGCWVFCKWDRMEYGDFYKIYPELKQYEDCIVLLWEQPWIENEEIKEDLSRENIYTKKFIVVQDWCDTGCSFCMSIKKRWRSRNRSLNEIIGEINKFVNEWWKEIALTWVNLAAWWCFDTKEPEQSNFSYLLEQILKKTSVQRIRLSSLWPEFLNDKFFETVSDQRIMPHFHFSVQSFSDTVLSNMNRNYSYFDLENVFNRIKNIARPDKDFISLWADIIVWFPWETDSDFKETLLGIEKFSINKVHVFPFSSHNLYESVPATNFPNQVKKEDKDKRKLQIINLEKKIRNNFFQKNKGREQKVLFEYTKNDKRFWWTENYIPVFVDWNFQKWNIYTIKL